MIENNDHVTKERRITYIAKRRMITFQEKQSDGDWAIQSATVSVE